MASRRSRGLLLLILLMVPLVSNIPFNAVMGEPSEGSISFQPSEMPNLTFDYNVEEYRFELTWKTFYLYLEPFAVYNGETRELKQIIPWLKNQYPQVNYRWAVTKFKNYHRWGYWLESLPQNVADNLDYLGFRLDYNFPLSAVDLEWVEATDYTFPRISLGDVITLDFGDLYEHGFTLEVNKTHMMIGNVKGKTDLDLDPITYAAATITVVGYTSGDPCTFWDVWNASNVNGWGMVHNNNETDTQYQFDCKLTIGDGSTNTYFTDTAKQITFIDGIAPAGWTPILEIEAKAYVTWGTLVDSDDKKTRDGLHFISLETTYHDAYFILRGDTIGEFKVYGCVFEGITCRILVGGATYIYNSQVQYGAYTVSDTDAIIHNLDLSSGYQGLREPVGVDIKEMDIDGYTWAIRTAGDYDAEIVNSTFANSGILRRFNGGSDGIVNLTDCEVDLWNMDYNGDNLGELFRKYTFKLKAADENGSGIENVVVTLTYAGMGGGDIGTFTTPINGSIPTQKLIKGFYNQTGVDAIYSYEPYTLTISKAGYEEHSLIFNISEPIRWVIPLVEEVVDVEINTSLGILPVFLGFMALVVILAANRRRR